jgi:hypothetical protein
MMVKPDRSKAAAKPTLIIQEIVYFQNGELARPAKGCAPRQRSKLTKMEIWSQVITAPPEKTIWCW